MKFTYKSSYFLIFVTLLATEILIAMYTTNWIRAYFGDFMVVILLYCLIMSLYKIKKDHTLIGILAFSYLVEILQHFRFVELIGLGHIPIANTLIGTSFSWLDVLMYTLGIVFTASMELINTKYFIPEHKIILK